MTVTPADLADARALAAQYARLDETDFGPVVTEGERQALELAAWAAEHLPAMCNRIEALQAELEQVTAQIRRTRRGIVAAARQAEEHGADLTQLYTELSDYRLSAGGQDG